MLGPGDATDAFLRAYGASAAGNFEGENILHRRASGELCKARHYCARPRPACY